MSFFVYTFLFSVCVVRGDDMRAMVRACQSEENLWRSAHSLDHVGSEPWTQVVRLGGDTFTC